MDPKAINDGGPAFPCDPFVASKPGNETVAKRLAEGMTLRDYFAAKAMQALIMMGATVTKHTPEGELTIPGRVGVPPLAYEYADAMLAAREA
ncbi:hypothetical protein [Achromobacter aloeverae]|uniref:Uncharacterized protein n=1 Tax=Achromobacter aloeverae TaxID=1750518 RepID=A0A4Q1HIN0_9BURK|nr:hypothetical protein [Achromobacter aloeverae]RXN87989.1 hypothetical protein C7R54_15545 [Achromobacter aloeverae]